MVMKDDIYTVVDQLYLGLYCLQREGLAEYSFTKLIPETVIIKS